MQNEVTFTDLIASSIHDMKNSLNLQISALEKITVQCRERGDISAVNDLGPVIYQANRINLNLVELLSLYKMDKSMYPLDIDEHAIAELIEEAMLQNQPMMDFKGIALSVDCAPDCYWYVERELIKGVLMNALNNAYNYTTDRIHVLARIADNRLELRVEDNGAGYPDRMLQAEGLSSKTGVNFESGSTGLGFYFADQVVRLHRNGGRCGTLSIENGGSLGGGCFVVRLP